MIGQRLKEERERLGLSQTDFAALAGAAKRTQIDWEKDNSSPNSVQLSSLFQAGVDVQYVVAGVRSSLALAPEERLLIDRYRQSPQGLRDAALRVLLGDKASGAMIFKGSVGQSVKVEGNLDQSGISFDMGKGKKRK